MRRIAIITSETPNSVHAGSMQLLRVFSGYPAEKLAVLGPPPPPNARILSCPYQVLHFPVMRLRNTRFHTWAMTGVLCLPALRRSPAYIDALLGEFTPDAVFTVMDNFSHYYSAFRYAQRRGIPLITVTMDEPNAFERIHEPFRQFQLNRLRKLYQYAETNLCVSRQMAAHLATDFACRTETLYFGPPDAVAPRIATESRILRRPNRLVIGYAGSLSYGYDVAIARIVTALRGLPVVFRIYSRDRPKWNDEPGIEYGGSYPSEELWTHFKQECDMSLLVYNFDYPNKPLYRTHFPTKLSEYAWLGMPMVMVGPEDATGIVWGREHPTCAVVESDPNLPRLGRYLEHLLADPERRATLAQAAAEAARTEFDPIRIRQRFHTVLSQPPADRP